MFDPHRVVAILDQLSYLGDLLDDPHTEGEAAQHLPGARTSTRQIYRVLGNPHYGHLAELLGALDACAGAGFTQPSLLRTRGRRPFAEALAELQTAEHYRRQRYRISGLGGTDDDARVPDILVEDSSLSAVIEVYCPRVWPGLADYTDAIHDRVKNLDRGFDFTFCIEHQLLDLYGSNMHHQHHHPDVLSHGLDETTRLTAIEALIGHLEAALDAGSMPSARYAFPGLNLATATTLDNIAPASGPVPARCGTVGDLPRAFPRPEAIFSGIVDRVIAKLAKQQAVGVVPGAVPVLVVELSQCDLRSELRDRVFYRPQFQRTLGDKLADLHGYGIVAFCEGGGWGRPLVPHFLRVEPAVVDMSAVAMLFPH